MITGFKGAIGTTGVLFIAMAALVWLALPFGHPVYALVVPPLIVCGVVYAFVRLRTPRHPSIQAGADTEEARQRDILAGTKTGTVAVIVDCCFGERLLDLARSGMPLWVMDTSANRVSLDDFRPAGALSAAEGITTFKVSPSESCEDAFIRILPSVDRHHNRLASNPPYTAVEVFGNSATPAVKKALHDFDFTVVSESSTHFRAETNPPQE